MFDVYFLVVFLGLISESPSHRAMPFIKVVHVLSNRAFAQTTNVLQVSYPIKCVNNEHTNYIVLFIGTIFQIVEALNPHKHQTIL